MEPTALRLFAVSIAARLPLAMLGIGVLVHVEHRTGSFAVAGAASGALAIAQGVGGPLLGRLVDRRGQRAVLVASAAVAAAALAGLALAASPFVLLALSGLLGLASPPVAACLRTLLPSLVEDPAALRGAYAADATAVELTWMAGPPLVLLAGSLLTTGSALLLCGGVLALATFAFAAAPASRGWRPPQPEMRAAGSALASPGIRTLALVLAGAGLLFGATEVSVTAASDGGAAAGPLLGLWGAGSFLGGLATTRLGGGARTGTGLAVLLAGLAAGHMALAAEMGSAVVLGAALALAGTMIAPLFATTYALVEAAAPAGAVTEAFAWMTTAAAIGTSAGAAAAGALVETTGPAATMLLAGTAAAGLAAVAAARAATLARGCAA